MLLTPFSFESGAKKITPEVGETACRYWQHRVKDST